MLSCKALLQTSNLEWIFSSHVFMSPLIFPFVFTYSVKKVISVLQVCSDTRGSLHALAKWGNHSKSGKTGKNYSCLSNNLNCIQRKPKLLLLVSCVLSPVQLSCYGIYFMVINNLVEKKEMDATSVQWRFKIGPLERTDLWNLGYPKDMNMENEKAAIQSISDCKSQSLNLFSRRSTC